MKLSYKSYLSLLVICSFFTLSFTRCTNNTPSQNNPLQNDPGKPTGEIEAPPGWTANLKEMTVYEEVDSETGLRTLTLFIPKSVIEKLDTTKKLKVILTREAEITRAQLAKPSLHKIEGKILDSISILPEHVEIIRVFPRIKTPGTHIVVGLSDDDERIAPHSGTEVRLQSSPINAPTVYARLKVSEHSAFSPLLATESNAIVANCTPIDDDRDLFETGWGNEQDPYEIRTKAQFNQVHKKLNAHYVLKSDLCFEDGETLNLVTGHPYSNNSAPFTGVFDGMGHLIKNPTIRQPDVEFPRLGLFPYLGSRGTVKNLGLIDVKIEANYDGRLSFGALVGLANWPGTSVSNSFVVGEITLKVKTRPQSSQDVGAVVGIGYGNRLWANATVKYQLPEGEPTGHSIYIGGIAGQGGCYDCAFFGQVRVIGPDKAFENASQRFSIKAGALVGYGTVWRSYATATEIRIEGNNLSQLHIGGLSGGCAGYGGCRSSFSDVDYTNLAKGVSQDFSFGTAWQNANTTLCMWVDRGQFQSCYFGTVSENQCRGVEDRTLLYGTNDTNAFVYQGWDFENTWERREDDYPKLKTTSHFYEP